MKEIRDLGNVDIYVIDQLLKGTINKNQRILDAGCGSGRNFSYLAKQKFNVTGIDPNHEHIQNLQGLYPDYAQRLHVSTIEAYNSDHRYDYIICNAVLHFADNHHHFNQMFAKLVDLLEKDGILFIRMTTDHGLNIKEEIGSGVYNLPDASQRYLISRQKVTELCEVYQLNLDAPFKTVLVEQLRSMTTIVFRKAR